jgi:hypothetical protein
VSGETTPRSRRKVATCPTSDALADMLVACTGPGVERTDAGVWILWGYDAKDGEP